MLDKNIFKEGVEKLVSIYPSWQVKTDDPKVMRDWYSCFEDFEDKQFLQTVNNYIKTAKFNPTVAGLMEQKASVDKPTVEFVMKE